MAHNNQLISTTKLKSIYNIDTAFSQGTSFVNSKDNSKMITTIPLKNYSLLFTDSFKDEKNYIKSYFCLFTKTDVGKDIPKLYTEILKKSHVTPEQRGYGL